MGIEERFCFRLHKSGGNSVLAVCDAGLLGKSVMHGEIEFHVSPSFYGEERKGDEDILAEVREAGIVNVVGKDIVGLLVENGLVEEECILWMGDVPHVQIVTI
jgi:hypothetical protein